MWGFDGSALCSKCHQHHHWRASCRASDQFNLSRVSATEETLKCGGDLNEMVRTLESRHATGSSAFSPPDWRLQTWQVETRREEGGPQTSAVDVHDRPSFPRREVRILRENVEQEASVDSVSPAPRPIHLVDEREREREGERDVFNPANTLPHKEAQHQQGPQQQQQRAPSESVELAAPCAHRQQQHVMSAADLIQQPTQMPNVHVASHPLHQLQNTEVADGLEADDNAMRLRKDLQGMRQAMADRIENSSTALNKMQVLGPTRYSPRKLESYAENLEEPEIELCPSDAEPPPSPPLPRPSHHFESPPSPNSLEIPLGQDERERGREMQMEKEVERERNGTTIPNATWQPQDAHTRTNARTNTHTHTHANKSKSDASPSEMSPKSPLLVPSPAFTDFVLPPTPSDGEGASQMRAKEP